MEVTQDNYRGGVFLGIYKGSIVQEFDRYPEEEKFKVLSREKKNGKICYYYQFKSLVGYITDIYIKYSNHIKSDVVYIAMESGDDDVILNFSLQSRYGSSFAKVLRNIDIDSKVEIKPHDFVGEDERTGKDRRFIDLKIYQHGEKLSWYWDNDNTPVKPRELRGGKWDYNDVEDFFYEETLKEISYLFPNGKQSKLNDDNNDGYDDRDRGNDRNDRRDDRRGDGRRDSNNGRRDSRDRRDNRDDYDDRREDDRRGRRSEREEPRESRRERSSERRSSREEDRGSRRSGRDEDRDRRDERSERSSRRSQSRREDDDRGGESSQRSSNRERVSRRGSGDNVEDIDFEEMKDDDLPF